MNYAKKKGKKIAKSNFEDSQRYCGKSGRKNINNWIFKSQRFCFRKGNHSSLTLLFIDVIFGIIKSDASTSSTCMANQWHFNFMFDVLNKQLLWMYAWALSNIQSSVNPSFHLMHNGWQLICIFEWFFIIENHLSWLPVNIFILFLSWKDLGILSQLLEYEAGQGD